ncbi:MAG: SCP2 sterol-binding domain-containing protein [Dehalococcoidia bacterium]
MTRLGNMDTQSLNFRQTIEGMPLVFDAAAAGDMKADIQFDASGPEPGQYHLCIDSGKCSFHKGPAKHPTLTIRTPSDIWLKIGRGELSGVDALVNGLYTVDGDVNLLSRLQQLFKRPDNFTVEAKGQRPAGPLPISGMAWMTILFVAWGWLFLLYNLFPLDYGITFAPPTAIILFVVVYRLIFNRPSWIEIVSLAFFIAVGILCAVMEVDIVIKWGSIIALLVMGMMWLGSMVPPSNEPLTAEYAKWRYVQGLWTNSMFIQPNLAICLVWGWQFVISAALAIVGETIYTLFLPLLGIRLLTLIPAFVFSSLYQKGTATRRFRDIDKNIRSLQIWAYVGLALAILLLLIVLFIGFSSA